MLHLSDGGHFENLAAYELIRRRCRHVVICDASADPAFTFENLGNLVRRVREDFGAMIDLDVSALKPGEGGTAKVHAVTGTIHYGDGGEPGIIVYIKPNLTGDEEEDVMQYKAGSNVFPHESTADQFFNEAQWEAYRCLGRHAVNDAFSVVSLLSQDDRNSADQCFAAVRRSLLRLPWEEDAAYQELITRFTAMETAMAEAAGGALLREAYPEKYFYANGVAGPANPPEHEVIGGLLRLTQTMADIFVACNLDHSFNDPLTGAWSNYVERWLAIPSLHRWWPVIKTLYGWEFTKFAEERLGLPGNPSLTPSITTFERTWNAEDPEPEWQLSYAGACWLKCMGQDGKDPKPCHSTALLQIKLADRSEGIAIALVKYAVIPASKEKPGAGMDVQWNADAVWLPPGWRQGTWRNEFIRQLIAYFGKEGYRRLRVIPGEKTGRSLAEYYRFGLKSEKSGRGIIELSKPKNCRD
jgi:hypothetical protein